MAISDQGKSLAIAEVHYEHAPIVEAVIDLQVRFKANPTQEALKSLSAQWKDRFPVSADLNFLQLGFNPAIVPQVQAASTPIGYRLTTAKNDRVLQLQARGLTYSHLAPYTTWEIFAGEFLELWRHFVSELTPEAVTRIAVRYINQIVIPQARFEASEYFKLYPEVPKDIPQDITGLFMQLQMPQRDISPTAMANINFGSGTRTPDGKPAFLLDFDVYATTDASPDVKLVANGLQELRAKKNSLFEACITDRTRGLIK